MGITIGGLMCESFAGEKGNWGNKSTILIVSFLRGVK